MYIYFAEFGVHLAEFTVDPQGPLAIRQLSSVLLRQYVEAHWSQISEKFRPPETSETVMIDIICITKNMFLGLDFNLKII